MTSRPGSVTVKRSEHGKESKGQRDDNAGDSVRSACSPPEAEAQSPPPRVSPAGGHRTHTEQDSTMDKDKAGLSFPFFFFPSKCKDQIPFLNLCVFAVQGKLK